MTTVSDTSKDNLIPVVYAPSDAWVGWESTIADSKPSNQKVVGLNYSGLYNLIGGSWDVYKYQDFPTEANENYVNYSSGWVDKVVGAYNAGAADLNLSQGVATSEENVLSMIASYAATNIKNYGIFSKFIPGAPDGILVGENYSNYTLRKTHWFTSPWIQDHETTVSQNITQLNGYVYGAEYKKLMSQSGSSNLDLTNTSFFIGGAISNSTINMSGSDNKTFIISPTANALLVGVAYKTNAWGSENWNKSDVSLLYPSAQGLFATNTLITGSGNDLVYFDSSLKTIDGGAGDDVFVPSYGSFNLSTDYFFRKLSTDTSGMQFGGYPTPSASSYSQLMFSPVDNSLLGSPGNPEVYSVVVSSHTTGSDYSNVGYSQTAIDTYTGNSSDSTTNINNYNNNVGGEIIHGGRGNDTFYGLDPSFYTNYNPGGSTEMYYTPNGAANNSRYAFQHYHTVFMYGGDGSNVFYLGNPAKIDTADGYFDGLYSYQIVLNHDVKVGFDDYKNINFVNKNAHGSVVSIDISGSSVSYSNTNINYKGSGNEESSSTLDMVKTGVDAVNGLFGIRDNYGVSQAFKLCNYLPYVGTLLTATSIGITAYEKLNSFFAKDAPPVTSTSNGSYQALGSWKKAVQISDWDPSCVIQLKVNPTITTLGKDASFNSVGFKLEKELSGSDSSSSTTVKYVSGKETSNPLIELTGFATDRSVDAYAYMSYDFNTGVTKRITADNLAFFGVIDSSDVNIHKLTNYTSGSNNNSFPFYKTSSGGSLFYWNDANNSSDTFDLMAARASASKILLEFDSRTLGWFWDVQYTEASKEAASHALTPKAALALLVIDDENSGLWFRDYSNNNTGTWKLYNSTMIDKNVDAGIAALRAQYYYQTNSVNGVNVDTTVKIDQKHIESYSLLKDNGFTSIDSVNYTDASMRHFDHIKNITFANKPVGQSNVNVYSVYTDSGNQVQVLESVVAKVDATDSTKVPTVLSQRTLGVSEVESLETQFGADINATGTIGASAKTSFAAVSDSAFVNAMYVNVLDRPADADGAAYHINKLTSGNSNKLSTIKDFMLSDEYGLQHSSSSEFVNLIYQDLLGRNPDKEGFDYWTNMALEGLTNAQLLELVANSPEANTIYN